MTDKVKNTPPVKTERQGDVWIDWLLEGRHSSKNMRHMRQSKADIESYAKRVLQHAKLQENFTLVDVGAGEGLVSFKAIKQIGPSLKVILTDISEPLLAHAKNLASEHGVASQCSFLHCPAEQLTAIKSASVDVVITRAVLAYVDDKIAALKEFHRILKPGGRISHAEPVLRDDALMASVLRTLVDNQFQSAGVTDTFTKLMHIWRSSQFPDTPDAIAANPLTNYTERDLVQWATACGFKDVHMELHIDVKPSLLDWETFLEVTPHPFAPSLGDIMREKFTLEERLLFEQVMRPALESDTATSNYRVAYLSAQKK